MNTTRTALLLLLTAAIAAVAENPVSGPIQDRVGFPKDYATRFRILRTVERDGGLKLVTVYGNNLAAAVTNRAGLPYPNGSVLVMETAGTRKGADGKADRTPVGGLVREQVLGLHVMRRGAGFGTDYGTKRSGEWEFVEYRADGSYLTPPAKSAACAECHIKAGKELDFVFHGAVTP